MLHGHEIVDTELGEECPPAGVGAGHDMGVAGDGARNNRDMRGVEAIGAGAGEHEFAIGIVTGGRQQRDRERGPEFEEPRACVMRRGWPVVDDIDDIEDHDAGKDNPASRHFP